MGEVSSETPYLEGCGMVANPNAEPQTVALTVGTILQARRPMKLIDVQEVGGRGGESAGYELRYIEMGQGHVIDIEEVRRHPTTQEVYLTVLAGPAGTVRTRCSLALKSLKGRDWKFWGRR